jgi:hypothetical protein
MLIMDNDNIPPTRRRAGEGVKHFASKLRKQRPRPTTEEALAIIIEYVEEFAELEYCVDVQVRKQNCSCFHDHLREEGGRLWLPNIAEALLDFFSQSATRRKEYLVEKIKIAWIAGRNARFPLPAVGKPTDDIALPSICKNTFFRLLGIGKTQYHSLLNQAKQNKILPHQNAGRPSNHSLDATVQAKLEVFFEELKAMASPRATRMVRMEIGMEVRDAEQELDELPSHFTGRHLYARFCEELGYKASLKNDKGAIEITPIPNFEGEQHKPPCLSTFQLFWQRNYPKMVIPNAREDVCNDCFVYAHSFRYFCSRAANHNNDESSDDEEVNGYENQEAAVAKASIHVERAAAQRKYFNEISESAEGDVLVCDFMQNLGIPYLGAEQSGATYYYSPLNVFVFGVVDMRTQRLHAFVYDEGTGKKGGNNVASMIVEYLSIYGMLQNNKKKLKIVMDNCSGQNKVSFYIENEYD